MFLYEITEFVSDFEESKDVLSEEEIETINNEIQKMLTNKSASIIKYTQNMNMQVSAIDNEIKRLQELKARKEKALENFKKYVKSNMLKIGVNKIDTGLGTISFRKSTKTIIDEDKLIPSCYDITYKRKTIKEIEEIAKDFPHIQDAIKKVEGVNLIIK